MALTFTDWNNYTDDDGNAQTLDWYDLKNKSPRPYYWAVRTALIERFEAVRWQLEELAVSRTEEITSALYNTLSYAIPDDWEKAGIPDSSRPYYRKNFTKGINISSSPGVNGDYILTVEGGAPYIFWNDESSKWYVIADKYDAPSTSSPPTTYTHSTSETDPFGATFTGASGYDDFELGPEIDYFGRNSVYSWFFLFNEQMIGQGAFNPQLFFSFGSWIQRIAALYVDHIRMNSNSLSNDDGIRNWTLENLLAALDNPLTSVPKVHRPLYIPNIQTAKGILDLCRWTQATPLNRDYQEKIATITEDFNTQGINQSKLDTLETAWNSASWVDIVHPSDTGRIRARNVREEAIGYLIDGSGPTTRTEFSLRRVRRKIELTIPYQGALTVYENLNLRNDPDWWVDEMHGDPNLTGEGTYEYDTTFFPPYGYGWYRTLDENTIQDTGAVYTTPYLGDGTDVPLPLATGSDGLYSVQYGYEDRIAPTVILKHDVGNIFKMLDPSPSSSASSSSSSSATT